MVSTLRDEDRLALGFLSKVRIFLKHRAVVVDFCLPNLYLIYVKT